jgi:uncharacterized protein DUF397
MSENLARLEATTWRTSSFTGEGQNCVVVGRLADISGVRDSKLGKASPTLAFPTSSFDAMLARLVA